MNYVYDTTILSVAPPQRGRANIELPSQPAILTSDGRELILSQCFLQWLYPDQTTSLYTSGLRPHSDDIIIKNLGGRETPFVLLPPGVAPPAADMPSDPYLTVVSLAMRRALAPPPSVFQPAPNLAPPRIGLTGFKRTPSKAWAMSQDRSTPPIGAPLMTAHTSTTNNIEIYLRGSAGCSYNDGCYTSKSKAGSATCKIHDALERLSWTLAAAGLGIVLAAVF